MYCTSKSLSIQRVYRTSESLSTQRVYCTYYIFMNSVGVSYYILINSEGVSFWGDLVFIGELLEDTVLKLRPTSSLDVYSWALTTTAKSTSFMRRRQNYLSDGIKPVWATFVYSKRKNNHVKKECFCSSHY